MNEKKNSRTTVSSQAVFLILFSIALFFSLPPLFGWLMTPDGHTFTGVRLWASPDTFVYYMYLEQVLDGSYLFTNLYSIEESLPSLNVFWLITGLVGSFLKFTPEITFAVFRFFSGFGLLLFVYFLLGRIVLKRDSLLALLFITFSSGLGLYWVFYDLSAEELKIPLDVGSSDFSLALTLAFSPHTIISTFLLLFELYFGYRAITYHSFRLALLVGVSALFHFQFHPYYIPVVFGVLAFYSIILYIRKKYPNIFFHFGPIAVIISFTLPSILYHLYYLFNDLVTLARAYDNVLELPAPHLLFISFGFLLPFSLLGVYNILKKGEYTDKNIFLLTWFSIQTTLILLPIPFQRKLLEGFWFILGVFAWNGLRVLLSYIRTLPFHRYMRPNPTVFIVLFSVMFLPSTFYNISSEYTMYVNPPTERMQRVFYYSDDERDGFLWLKHNTPSDSVVLSHPNTGLFIPVYAGRTSYIGHWSETVYSHQEKRHLLNIFFLGTPSSEWRKDFLKKNSITYLWWGWQEKVSPFNPGDQPYLTPIYSSPKVTVYQVVQ